MTGNAAPPTPNVGTYVRRGIWLLLAVLVCLWPNGLWAFVADLRTPRTSYRDFFQEWASAKFYHAGMPIYSDLDIAIEEFLGEKRDKSDPRFFDVNAHPPFSVLLALPFGLLDYSDASLAWNLVCLLALLLGVWLVLRELQVPLTIWVIPPLVVLTLLCNPIRSHFNLGQMNLILLPFITGAWAADRRGRPWLAGGLIGAAAAIKLVPAFLVLYFIGRRQWRGVAAVAAAAAVGIGLSLLPLLFVGLQAYRDYVEIVLPRVAEQPRSWMNISLAGWWSRLFDPAGEDDNLSLLFESRALAQWGTRLCIALLVGLVVYKAWNAASLASRDRAFGLAVVAMLLVSPIAWDHYMVLLLVPLAVLWQQLPHTGWERWLYRICLMAIWIPAAWVWATAFPGVRSDNWFYFYRATPVEVLTIIAYPTYALLGLVYLIARKPRAGVYS